MADNILEIEQELQVNILLEKYAKRAIEEFARVILSKFVVDAIEEKLLVKYKNALKDLGTSFTILDEKYQIEDIYADSQDLNPLAKGRPLRERGAPSEKDRDAASENTEIYRDFLKAFGYSLLAGGPDNTLEYLAESMVTFVDDYVTEILELGL